MKKSVQKVVIDADFFRHTTDHEIGTALFEQILKDNSFFPVMHKYVADIELKNNEKLNRLINSKKIEILGEKDYILDENKDDYIEYFNQAYGYLNERAFDEDVFSYGYDGKVFEESLGEIRSVHLALSEGYKLLLSDDADSKRLSKFINSSKHSLKVINFYELIIGNKKINGSLRWKDLKVTVPIVFKDKKNKLDKIVEIYKL